MYLTNYRERSPHGVITQLEHELFKKAMWLDIKDFELLCSLGVFNASLMNNAIFKFKRYENSSPFYTGIDKHQGKNIGGWDTVIRCQEYAKLFYNQLVTIENDHPPEALPDDSEPKEDQSPATSVSFATVK